MPGRRWRSWKRCPTFAWPAWCVAHPAPNFCEPSSRRDAVSARPLPVPEQCLRAEWGTRERFDRRFWGYLHPISRGETRLRFAPPILGALRYKLKQARAASVFSHDAVRCVARPTLARGKCSMIRLTSANLAPGCAHTLATRKSEIPQRGCRILRARPK